MDIKQELVKIVKRCDKDLGEYWEKEISKSFGFNERQKKLIKKLLIHAKEHNLRPAKRLRAALVYFGYKLTKSKIDERILAPMRAVELVHTALLVQDDVMDQDEIRRGRPTTHRLLANGDKHYGESMAYCLGDAVLTLGFEELLRAKYEKEAVNEALGVMLRGITNTVYGQIYDISLEKYDKWNDDDILALHKAKTAIYTYRNPLLVGAILGKADKKTLDILEDYSMKAGVAFQIQDDILGMFGDSEKTGKSESSDLLQGKVTLLTVKTLTDGSEEEKRSLLKVWGKRKAKISDIEKAKEAIRLSGALDYSKRVSQKLAEEAMEISKKIKNKKTDTEAAEFIEGVARYMVEREY